ncbi:YicC/YloC family endoribonuclease [Laceyella putida]|uniref:YicC/YloC family endoribonuclease n=1 Tax=Laceyella putida TaxID=110101 RepID=A0ABW2RN50_9BACL
MTVTSMTGYGRGEVETDEFRVTAEIRSVNHRFLEVMVRLPQGWMALEEPVRRQVQKVVRRGRVDVFISLEGTAPPERKVEIDWRLVESFVAAGAELQHKWGIEPRLTLADLIHKPDFWMIEEAKWDIEEHKGALLQAVEQACARLKEMRRSEGFRLAEDVAGRLAELRRYVQRIEAEVPRIKAHVEGRLMTRLKEMLADVDTPPERVVTEVAVWVEKADITEELTRLKSHAEQFQAALCQNEPVGRRLDFLVQEMNREVNTIGAKANLHTISAYVVDCKSVLEKMKEQVQNIE